MLRFIGLIAVAVLPIGLPAGESSRHTPCAVTADGTRSVPATIAAGEKKPPAEYAQFSRLVHSIVIKQLPPQVEDSVNWGQRIEIPPKLPLMLLRTTFKAGDKLEAPHGSWFRFKGRIEEPAANLKISVRDFKKLDDKTYRLAFDVDVTVTVDVEYQQWQKGLLLVALEGTTDSTFTAGIVCDVGAAVNLKKLPPEVNIDPKVTSLDLNLIDFKVRGGPILPGEKGKALTDEFKNVLRAAVKTSEPFVKEFANQAIAEGLKEGKGSISARELLKALPTPKK